MKVNNHDSVDISSMARAKRGDKSAAAKKAQEAANSIARSENVDQAKIDRIKAMINGGTYKPDMGQVAEKMMNETLLQDIS